MLVFGGENLEDKHTHTGTAIGGFLESVIDMTMDSMEDIPDFILLKQKLPTWFGRSISKLEKEVGVNPAKNSQAGSTESTFVVSFGFFV